MGLELLEDVKFELGIELDDNEQDILILHQINKAKTYIRTYCNNSAINFEESRDLDDVIIYIVAMRMNPDTKFGNSAGKSNDRGMLVNNFLEDFPSFIQASLKPYKKSPKVKFL